MPNDPHSSAISLDALVRATERLSDDTAPDSLITVAMAVTEFALGTPLATRALDLCWGAAPLLSPQFSNDAGKELVLSFGLSRISGALAELPAETAFNPLDGIESSINRGSGSPNDTNTGIAVQDAYAFGSVFLSGVSLSVQLVTGAAGSGGQPALPLLMAKTAISIDDALDALREGHVHAANPPANSIELARFVVDIDTYYVNADPRNVAQVHVVDLRRPRGWAGFAEETMATSLIPPLGAWYLRSVPGGLSLLNAAVKSLVTRWVFLPDWNPSFLGYWLNSGNTLPTRLAAYLNEELGILV